MQSSWRGSLSEVKKYLNVARRRRNSPIAFPNGDTSSIKEKEHDALMGSALFVSSRRGNEEICRFLLKSGRSKTLLVVFLDFEISEQFLCLTNARNGETA